ncbi:hypothetical protein [Streptomyces sp. A012304]|uniref:hypothetical protein n=1 Tax=Streptomyces sp. A012304 TaxID=375446 RepID=UPI00223034EC|nr:hypothetical protein [Streptomyces sp. A012304]GKQ39556.1 hypothetical protein ALMP_60830 [Streptomyces sp. A012304]
MPTRRPRTRLLAAALTCFAALALNACHDGEGLRDEGPSGSYRSAPGQPVLHGADEAPARRHAEPPSGNS